MKFLFWTALVPITLAVSGCSSLYYFPQKKELVYRHKLPIQPEDVYFNSEDGTKLHAWHFKALNTAEPKAVIVQFHGNGQNLTTHFLSLYEAPSEGIAYLVFDYRGYGESEGRPNPSGVIKDGVAAIRWMHKKYPNKPLIVFAQSLGGAIAFKSVNKIKSEVPIALMVAECTFPDYRTAARTVFANSFLTYLFQPLAWAVVDNSESPKEDIPQISPIPLIVVHGTKDQVLPDSLGKKIFELAKEPKEFWPVPGGRHLEFMFKDEGKFGEKFYERVEKIAKESRTHAAH